VCDDGAEGLDLDCSYVVEACALALKGGLSAANLRGRTKHINVLLLEDGNRGKTQQGRFHLEDAGDGYLSTPPSRVRIERPARAEQLRFNCI
jgi:hypothetical protein